MILPEIPMMAMRFPTHHPALMLNNSPIFHQALQSPSPSIPTAQLAAAVLLDLPEAPGMTKGHPLKGTHWGSRWCFNKRTSEDGGFIWFYGIQYMGVSENVVYPIVPNG